MPRAAARKMPAPPPEPALRTVTVRMPSAMHEQLRTLAFHERTAQHTLIMEGINLMFRRHGQPAVEIAAE
jgi:hypothetical protein